MRRELVARLLVAALVATVALGGGIARAQQEVRFVDADGAPLPFRHAAEVKEFLATADIVARRTIDVGITGPWRLTLEKDGVRADAVFRHFERRYEHERARDGRFYVNFTDSHRFEVAAYELACLLGMDNVPPAVSRRIGVDDGTVQLWVHDAMMETERVARRLAPPDYIRWLRQRQQMLLFDTLIGNVDRNGGNLLYDGDWKLWLIDHTRAFYGRAGYERLDEIIIVERELWRRLRALDETGLRAALGDHLSGARIRAVLERRDRIVEHIERVIDERGAGAVLYAASPVS